MSGNSYDRDDVTIKGVPTKTDTTDEAKNITYTECDTDRRGVDVVICNAEDVMSGKVQCSSNDASSGTLDVKLIGQAGITITEQNDGGAETCDVDVAINPEALVTVAATDEVLIADASDSFNIKKVTAQDIADLAPDTDTFADVQVDGVSQSTGAPTLDFAGSDFLLTESPTDDFDITIKDSGIDHDATTNYVAAEHIDWTQSGAGTIHASNYVDNDTIYTHPNHSGEVTSTGDGVQVVDKTAISNQASVTAAATDTILIGDASDTNNLKKVTAQSIADLGGGGGLWTDSGAHTYLTSTTDNISVGTSSAPPTDYRMLIANGAGKNGLDICVGENLGDIGLHIADQDDTFTTLEVEMDQGYVTFGETYAQTLTNNGVVYGVDNQNDGVSADFNCQNGSYRVGGDDPGSEVTATANTSTSSHSYVTISGMTFTSTNGGTYMVSFSASGRGTADNQQMQYAIFDNGVVVQHTERDLGWEADNLNEDKRLTLHSQGIITLSAGQTVTARYKTNAGTFNVFERSMMLLKIHA